MFQCIRNKLLALGAAVCTCAALAAPQDQTVVITAKRFAEASTTANVSVINQDEIQHSPARSIPDLLKTLAGVDIRPLYGSMGIDTVVDIRGSGEAAGNNTLVLVDGQRLNPVDMGGVKWETIPLSAIKQIEIVRGSGSVLYGDRAGAGVINIITDKSNTPRAMLKAERGSFRSNAFDAALAGGKDDWYGNLFAHHASTDGYRANSDAEQNSAGGRAAYRFGDGEAFLDLSGYRERYGLPGTLSRAQFDSDPRQSTSPNYRLERDGYRLRPGGSFRLGADLRVEIDGSFSNDLLQASNPDWFYRSESRVKASMLSPRLKWAHSLAAALSSETVAGVDVYRGWAYGDNLDFMSGSRQNRQTGEQQSQGIYLQNVSLWNNGFDTLAALRHQHFEQTMRDEGAGLRGHSSDSLQAWELGLGYRINASWRTFVKAARNFRLPNTDELFAYDPVTYKVLFNGALRPQTGRLYEAGIAYRSASLVQQLSVFRQKYHNEIGFIAANDRNANLDPTRRWGAEWEARWYLSPAWLVKGSLTAMRATFREGAYDGKSIPLVPRHKETLGVQWNGNQAGTHNLVLVGVGSRYFGGDFDNRWRKLDGYTTLDYQAQWQVKPVTLIFRAANLTDRKYSASGFSSAFNPGTFYPADPRSYSLSIRADLL
ncbi:MAG: TonB-dependent receptor [Betaproteobacteria bacterium]|nr:TonB-dependent receptor [Betaproteobacteria bacterium]